MWGRKASGKPPEGTFSGQEKTFRVNDALWGRKANGERPEGTFSGQEKTFRVNDALWDRKENGERPEGTFSRQNKTFRVQLVAPYLLPNRLNGQKYLVFLQQVLPHLPRNEFFW
ncbi:hypothetical protein AVEN_93334-1 [Araneus ventricosus]|uniref:Uncharacterized protein n=1 Tax=Araneus ventricosus TaxID=182803 RepID=A0A4Y2NIW3_ARAVE|nr:hypothetical protein AVEN_93334-1 [Araneus ventricosus]